MLRRWSASALLAAALLMSAARPADAQSFGARGGASLSRVEFDDNFANSTAFVPGAFGGGYVSIDLPWQLRAAVEALFAFERTALEGGPEDRFRYLDVPVLVGRRVATTASGRPVVVMVGAAYRHLLDATETFADETVSITEGVRENDVAIVVGLDFPFQAKWSLDVRYVHGQNEIFRRLPSGYAGRWRSAQVGVRYTIR